MKKTTKKTTRSTKTTKAMPRNATPPLPPKDEKGGYTFDREDRRVNFQGDTLLMKVTALPPEATKADHNIVAHSETGHHHIVEGAELFEIPGDMLTLYARATKNDVSFKHLRDYSTHLPISYKAEIGDIFRINRQKESTPDGWKRVED